MFAVRVIRIYQGYILYIFSAIRYISGQISGSASVARRRLLRAAGAQAPRRRPPGGPLEDPRRAAGGEKIAIYARIFELIGTYTPKF